MAPRWTADEMAKAYAMLSEGFTYSEIGSELGRSTVSVRRMLCRAKSKLTGAALYVVTDGTYHKIGVTSRNIQERIRNLQTGNGSKIRLCMYISVDPDKHRDIEDMLHKAFLDKRAPAENEWFDLDESDLHKIPGMIDGAGR